jgi:hypothetical protein
MHLNRQTLVHNTNSDLPRTHSSAQDQQHDAHLGIIFVESTIRGLMIADLR